MRGKKRILALVGAPLGASLALAPALSAEAHAATSGKSAVAGAASLPSITPTASCSVSGIEDPNESATIKGAGFGAGQLVTFFVGKRAITTATADAGGAVSAVAVVKAAEAVTAQEGANQQGCLNLVKPPVGTPTEPNVPGPDLREQALAAGENDADATCRQKVDQFKLNADKSAAFRADYASGFNNKVAATVGCAAMLAQLRSGVPATPQTPNENPNANANANANQNQNQNANQNQNQNQNRGEQGRR